MFILTTYGELLFENLIQLLLVCSGGIKINPGPKTKNQKLFCQLSLNGLAAHNFTKVSLLQAFSATPDYNIICLSKTFLDTLISNGDERINIKSYNLLREDHPNHKKEEVFVCKNYNISTNSFLFIIRRFECYCTHCQETALN